MDAGGIITLDEPLSIEELQTGALVLLMTRNGQPCEAVGVVSLRSVGVINDIQFYAFGRPVAEVFTSGSVSDITRGVFDIRIVDRAAHWQITGARIDRQFWHGGSLASYRLVGVDGGAVVEGADGLPVVSSYTQSGADFEISLDGVCPIGGGVTSEEYVELYSGNASLNDFEPIVFQSVVSHIARLAVKAVLMIEGGVVVLAVLYPRGPIIDYIRIPLSTGTEDITPDDVGPWYVY